MICDCCQKTKTNLRSAVVSGAFYKNVCEECLAKTRIVSSGHARWERSIDLEDHEADIQQPYNADGTINTRFAKLYPKQAKALFSESELRKASLNL